MRVVGFVYMLRCNDGRYYVGSHRGEDVQARVWEHNSGVNKQAYTFMRRPVELVWSEYFSRYNEMVSFERQLKGWSRAKKEALIRHDSPALRKYSARGFKPTSNHAHPSRRLALQGSSG